MPLKVNDIAPDFTLPSTGGTNFHLNAHAGGHPIILYFYPKDFTRGCTTEACEFRDRFDYFKNIEIDIVGISQDSVSQHEAFKKEYSLPFELLSDANGKVSSLYKARIPILGVTKRITYLLDREHKIADVIEDFFQAKKHIHELVKRLQEEK